MIRYDLQMGQGDSSPNPQSLGSTPLDTSCSAQEPQQSFGQIKEQAIQKRDEVTAAVRTRAASYFDQQKGRVADTLQDVTSATRQCVGQMRQQDHPRICQAVESIADRVDHLGQTIRQKDANYFIDRSQDYARRHPGLFLGGALALGFLAVRFLRSSSPSASSTVGEPGETFSETPIPGIHNEIPASSGTQFTI